MSIAVFDSGIGGLSVLQQAKLLLPHKDFLYYADTAHVPYGVKTKDEVIGYVAEAVDFLLHQDSVEALVIACNTATSVAAPILRARFQVPILGMEPAVKPAVTSDRVHRVLVTATPLTLQEKKMQELLDRWDSEHLADLLPLPGLVEFAEKGCFDTPQVEQYLHNELKNYDLANYSAIVLGCTHFNFFRKVLRRLLPMQMHILDGTLGTVHNLATQVSQEKESGKVRFFNSYGEVKSIEEIAHFNSLLDVLADNMQIS